MAGKLQLSELTDKHIETKASETVYQGYARVQRYTLTHQKFDGSWTPEIHRELFISGDAVVVLPYDPKMDAVLLVEQWRVSAHDRGIKPWLVECIAGRIAKGETPEEVAVREAREEANVTLDRLEKIGDFYPSPGIFAEFVSYYCAKADLSAAGGIHGLPSEEEDIKAHVVDFNDALTALTDGRIIASTAFMCLTWLAQNKARLINDWTTG